MTPRLIVFVNRFYWPDEQATAQLLTDLAQALVARGYAVAVVTSLPAGPGIPRTENRCGVTIHRVRSYRARRRGLVARLLEFASFYPGALWQTFRHLRSGDTVVAMTDPPLIGMLVSFVARLRGAKLIHWVQDIYPEIAMQLTGHRWLAVLVPLRNYAWRCSCTCLVPGSDMAAGVISAGMPQSKVLVFPNWSPQGVTTSSPSAINAWRKTWALEEKFVVAYSGNLGRVHDLVPLLDVAARFNAEPDFVLVLIGTGAQQTELESGARARGLRNVRFLPPQPRDVLADALSAADVHFVTLQRGAERYVFPSKLYGVAHVGRPVLFIGAPDCEIARLIQARGFGTAFTRDQIDAIATELARLKADASLRSRLGLAASAFAARGLERAVDGFDALLSRSLRAGTAAFSESRTR